MLVTRIAPTPSGYLHPGNAVNFLLTAWLARQCDARLLLRIDDFDAGRVRREYVADIFAVLHWLGIVVDGGPTGAAQFEREPAGADRIAPYRAALDELRGGGANVFACGCSRRELAGHARYPGTCRQLGLAWRPGETSLRVEVPAGCRVRAAETEIDLGTAMGDFVVWRRDDLPAYQLASVVADRELGVNVVVRGSDLLVSTAAQLFLAPMLGASLFAAADFRHHRLLTGPDGAKLSKSAGRQAASMVGDAALLERIRGWARDLAPEIGVQPQ